MAPGQTTHERAARRRNAQFSLRGLFTMVFSAAIGLSMLTPGGANWRRALVTAIVVWIVLGVIRQASDLAATYRGRGDLSQDQRWGWRFAALWRLGLAGLLAGVYLVDVLAARKLLEWSPSGDNRFEISTAGIALRGALLDLPVLIILCNVPRRTTPRLRLWWSRCLDIIGGMAGAVLCLLVVMDQVATCFLIHLSFVSIEQRLPLRWAVPEVAVDVAARSVRFFCWSVLAGAVVMVDFLLVRELARQWARGRARRWLLGALLAAGIAASTGYAVWVRSVGLWSVSPYLPEGWVKTPWHLWLMAIILVALVVSVGAYRLVRGPSIVSELPWRRHPGKYYHERPMVLGSLIVALLLESIRMPHSTLGASLTTFLGLLLISPGTYPRIAVVLAAIGALWASWRRPNDALLTGPPELPLGAFAATWFALFLTVVFGAPAIAGLGFSMWIVPWPGE